LARRPVSEGQRQRYSGITRICNKVLATEEVPRYWKNGIMFPLPKTSCVVTAREVFQIK